MMKALAFLPLLLCAGCAQIPVARSYSFTFGDGKQSIGASVRFEPPPAKADPKKLREPVTTIDFRRERIVDPGTPELRGDTGGQILIVTRDPSAS